MTLVTELLVQIVVLDNLFRYEAIHDRGAVSRCGARQPAEMLTSFPGTLLRWQQIRLPGQQALLNVTLQPWKVHLLAEFPHETYVCYVEKLPYKHIQSTIHFGKEKV